jgi:hypothetical protein
MGKDGTTEWSTVIPTKNKRTLEGNPKTPKVP